MKINFLIIALLFFSVENLKAQTICDSISIDTAFVDQTSVQVTVYNSSSHFIVYPLCTAILDPNPYIVLNDSVTIPSFLSIPGDANNGYTTAFYLASIPAAATVPWNTLFTGTLIIQDPNDSSFICSKSFSFNYGTMVFSISELQPGGILLYPNPSSGDFKLLLSTENADVTVKDVAGREIFKTIALHGINNLRIETDGIYFVKVMTKQGVAEQKIVIRPLNRE